MSEFGRLVQRPIGLGARHHRHLVEVAAVPGFVMLIEFVVGLGVALCGRLAQQGQRLDLPCVGHRSRYSDLEMGIFGLIDECQGAAFAPQGPAAAQRLVAHIALGIFGKAQTEFAGIGRIQRRFRLRSLGLRRARQSRWQQQRRRDGERGKQQDRRHDRARRHSPAHNFGTFRGADHVHAIRGLVAARPFCRGECRICSIGHHRIPTCCGGSLRHRESRRGNACLQSRQWRANPNVKDR